MPWTYGHDPAGSERDHVRFLVGDTDENDQLEDDRVIDWALGDKGNPEAAAVAICRGLASRFAREASAITIGRVKRQYQNRADAFAQRADDIESNASTEAPIPEAPATTISGVAAAATDTSRTVGVFRVGMQRNPRS